jgi:hypothetical protein
MSLREDTQLEISSATRQTLKSFKPFTTMALDEPYDDFFEFSKIFTEQTGF